MERTEQNKPYLIHDGIFTFLPDFNAPINANFTYAMTSCHTLSFQLNTSSFSKFDQVILPHEIPPNIINIIFGSCLDKHVSLPVNLEKITFGYWFNQTVHFPQTVKYIWFDTYYNQPTILPDNLLEVYFGDDFNCEIILPNTLEKLRIGFEFNQRIIFPDRLVWLEINSNNHWACDNLPNSLKILEIGEDFCLPLVSLPNNLKCIILHSSKYPYLFCEISKNVKVIRGLLKICKYKDECKW